MSSKIVFNRRKLISNAACLVGAVLAPAFNIVNAADNNGEGTKPIVLALIESLSGAFANTGEAVYRNILWAVERINAHGGVQTRQGARPVIIRRYDNKGQVQESLSMLKAAIADGAEFILQGNSSSVAAALIDAINKNNQRNPNKRVLFLNYSAVEPALTNEQCSFWHFRFDAHADMRLAALMKVIEQDSDLKSIYLIGQDYSFGQTVLNQAQKQILARRADVKIAGKELHPVGRVKDFLPYVSKIRASGAGAVLTGNWGNDLTLLVKAARDAGYEGKFYTFYGNALGAPAAMGDAGIDKVVAVADWLPNMGTAQSDAFYEAFRNRFPKSEDDYVHMRMQLMVLALKKAIEKAGGTGAVDVARALESVQVSIAGQSGFMRADDHQFQQPLVVGMMQKKGAAGVRYDTEGSGYGFKVVSQLSPTQAAMPHSCKMSRF